MAEHGAGDTSRPSANPTVEQVVDAAVEAARPALQKIIGTKPAAYDKADRFMETFVPLLRGHLEGRLQPVVLSAEQIARLNDMSAQLRLEGRRVYAATLNEVIDAWYAQGDDAREDPTNEIWYLPPDEPGAAVRTVTVVARERTPNGYTMFRWIDTGQQDKLRHPDFTAKFRRGGT